ncbi:hypothetical protein NAPIS_ORF00225 [Vairimorpha apis BRL 01]|uniref:Uncharacterized protein n=1 Tax=Vairimorpha apis BRL 01 TaxID=1037528 RepID=T0LD17_9MICR|nr:hypothetical protein NAPIS_ORF00225 [Vairimorpha apis BRL 01]
MPEMFEIETRLDSYSYYLKIFPVPRQDNRVVDKDWFWNDHKLILHDSNDWMSEHFTFAMVPQHMLKIVVKDKCVETTDDNYVKAVTCRSKKDSLNQYYRWFGENEREIVEDWVEHNGGKIKRRDRYPVYRPNRRPNRYDDDDLSIVDFIPPGRRRPYRPSKDYDHEEVYPNDRRPTKDITDDELDIDDFYDFHRRRPRYRPPRKRPGPYDDYDDYDRYPSRYPQRPNRYDDDQYDRYPSRYPQRPIGNDPCDQFGCDDNSNRGPPGKSPWNNPNGHWNNQNDPWSNPNGHWNNQNDPWSNPNGNRPGKQNSNKYGCDDTLDSIEKVICELNGNPQYML